MNWTYSADLKYARMVCDKVGLGLKIGEEHTTPSTDGKYMYLPPLDPMWSKSSPEYRDWWYSLLHESFHNIHSSDFDLIKDKKVNMKSFLGMVLNISMDYKIETCNRGAFAGRDSLVHQARYAFAKEKIYAHIGKIPAGDELRAICDAIWVMDSIARIPWIPEYKHDNIPGLLAPESEKPFEALLSHPTLLKDYQNQKTSEDTWDVVMLILKVTGVDPSDPKCNPPPLPKDEEEAKAEGMGWQKFSEIAVHDHSESNRDAGMHIEFDEIPSAGGWVPLPIKECDFDGPYREPVSDRQLAADFDTMFSQVHLSKKIRRELQSMARTRTVVNQRRGRVHGKALVKTSTDANAKVMKKKDVRFSPKSTAVMVLQDWSGSMGFRKYKAASVASHELGRVLHALQVPFAIHGFSTIGGQSNFIFNMKKFSETFNTEKYRDRCIGASHHMHSNADGDCLLWAAEKLMARKADRRIMFVLSDGSPAATDLHGNRHDGLMHFTQNVVKGMENKGAVEVYGIGIMDDNVRQIYNQCCVIAKPEELEGKLLNVLRNKILAGMMS